MYYIVLSQIAEQPIISNDAANWGIFLSAIGGIIIFTLNVITNRMKSRNEIKSKKESHELDENIKEDMLSQQAKAFLTEQARENIVTIKRMSEDTQARLNDIQKENHTYFIELAELRALDKLRSEEIIRLREDVKTASVKLTDATESLHNAKTQLVALQVRVAILAGEIENLKQKLKEHEVERMELIKEISTLKNNLLEKEKQVAEIESINSHLQTEIAKLKSEIVIYRMQIEAYETKNDNIDIVKTGETH